MSKHDSKTADLVNNSIQPLVKDRHGVERFKENKIVSFLLDNGGFDMNNLACMDFSENDREHFAQLIGYSLDGFGMLSYVSDETYYLAEKQRRPQDAELELVELRKKNAELVQFISENTPILSYLAIECTTNLNEFKSWLAIRDLEQQAKGLDLALSDYPCMYGDTKVYVADLENRAKNLREQAKQLKG